LSLPALERLAEYTRETCPKSLKEDRLD
jgi:hypothetical protein